MKDAIKIARMIFDGLSEADKESLYAWMGKQAPKPGPKRPKVVRLSSAARWWLAKLESGHVVPGAGWPTMLLVADLVDDYIRAIKRDITRRGNATAMGRFLAKVGAIEKTSSLKGSGGPRQRHYLLHSLGECRAAFEAENGPQVWTAVEAQKGVEESPDAE